MKKLKTPNLFELLTQLPDGYCLEFRIHSIESGFRALKFDLIDRSTKKARHCGFLITPATNHHQFLFSCAHQIEQQIKDLQSSQKLPKHRKSSPDISKVPRKTAKVSQ